MPNRRRRTLVIILLVIVASWLAAFSFTLWRLRVATLDAGLHEATTHARNFEKHLSQTLEMIDLIAIGLEPWQGSANLPQQVAGQLGHSLRQAPFLRSISLLDAKGLIIASSTPNNIGRRLDQQDFYPDIDPDARIIRIGNPWQGRDLHDGRPLGHDARPAASSASFIPVVRRIGNGAPGYWLVAAINPDYFILHATQLLPAPAGHVQWLRQDGQLLISSRETELPGAYGLAGQVQSSMERQDHGELAQQLPDGQAVLTAYRGTARFPALVAIHVDQQTLLARWAREARQLSWFVLPVLLALCLATVLIHRRQTRLDAREQELANQRRLAASVFQASTDAILMTSPDGDMIAVNPAFERITGYPATAAIGRNPRLLASGLHDTPFYRSMWQEIGTRGHWQGEIINRKQSGEHYDALLTINAVRDADGQLLHYVGIMADITERKQYEAALLGAKERAEAALLAKTTFLATMSHELRTPMNGVLGMTEILLRSSLTEKQQYQLNIVRESAESLLAILNQILDYATITSRGIQLEESAINPAALIHDLVTLFRPHAEAKSLLIRDRVAPGIADTLQGDPIRLRQILTHLVSNAVKFTRSGEIIVAVDTPETGKIVFSVCDTGIGIDPDKQAIIFDAFTQADGSAARCHGGTGLGLAICRRLVDAMDGQLTVDSTPGQGSCFTLTLPLHGRERPPVKD